MERKQQHSQEEERVKSSTITTNGDHAGEEVYVSEKQVDDDDDDKGINSNANLSILKREISCHSLYGLLVQSHLGCLKLCLGNTIESIDNVIDPTAANSHPNLIMADDDLTELDQFMEAYCVTLNKLKEVIEKPQQESMAFINYMYSQLDELEELNQTAELNGARGMVEAPSVIKFD